VRHAPKLRESGDNKEYEEDDEAKNGGKAALIRDFTRRYFLGINVIARRSLTTARPIPAEVAADFSRVRGPIGEITS
jgi:hypothetical protein